MQNYFNYFTEIEERFQRRRGSLLLLSTLDWALIETWREAGVPLEAVLRGVDQAFDRYDARKGHGRQRRINGLAWCAQEVMTAVEEMKEAATGATDRKSRADAMERGFEPDRIAGHLESCVRQLESSPAADALGTISGRLGELARGVRAAKPGINLDIERIEADLAMMEEKLFAILLTSEPEEDLLALRRQAASELAPYRSRMKAPQIRQIEQQFERKRLLEKHSLPRLSLFYMSHS